MGQNRGVHQEDSEFAGFYLLSHRRPPSLSSTHIKVETGWLVALYLRGIQLGADRKRAQNRQRNAGSSHIFVHFRGWEAPMSSFVRTWCQQSDSGKTTLQRAPFWSPACKESVQLLIDWVGPVVIPPRDGISSIRTCDRCRKMRGLIKNLIQICCRHPVESL